MKQKIFISITENQVKELKEFSNKSGYAVSDIIRRCLEKSMYDVFHEIFMDRVLTKVLANKKE